MKDFLIVLAGFLCMIVVFWRQEIHSNIESVPAWVGIVIILLIVVIFLGVGLELTSFGY